MAENRAALDVNLRAVRRGVIVGGAGGLISLVGFTMTTRELVGALRRYVRSMPVPPTQVARHHAALARAAATAGAAVWRQGSGAGRPSTIDLTEGADLGVRA